MFLALQLRYIDPAAGADGAEGSDEQHRGVGLRKRHQPGAMKTRLPEAGGGADPGTVTVPDGLTDPLGPDWTVMV